MDKKKKKGTALMTVGILLFIGALGLTAYNYYSEYSAEKRAVEVMSELNAELTVTEEDPLAYLPDYVVNPDMEMPVKKVKGNSYVGTLEVFALGLELPVISEWSYDNFKKAPCRYEGTPYKDNFIIAAHNYRSHFAYLRNLKPGDKITFTDMDNNVFNYQVLYTEILDKSAVKEMSEGEWDLTLFTCTYGGATRGTVRCEKIQ